MTNVSLAMSHRLTRLLVALALLLSPTIVARAAPQGSFAIREQPVKKIAVLLFHQVSDHPIESAHGVDHIQEPWTTPAAFDTLLTDLAHNGFTIVPLQTALQYLQGKLPAAALPEKPLLLTFDDGYLSAWTQATPILIKHHATATMFFEGHATNNPEIPGRLNGSDLHAMAESGVWTLESHGWAGHSNVRISQSGALSPYWYANLAWLPDKRRLETAAEFETRIQSDLTRMRTAFQADVGYPLTVFAYPSGEYGQNAPLAPGADPNTAIEAGHSNVAGLTRYVVDALRASGYEAAFAVSLPESAHLASPSDDLYALPRVGVGAKFQLSFLEGLTTEDGIEYPEIADGHVADVGPICATGEWRFVAATNRPVIFRLDRAGHRLAASSFPELSAGRASASANISAIACNQTTLWAVQDAGFDVHPKPWMNRFTIGADGSLTLAGRDSLPPALNWLVGIALNDGTPYGLTDSGRIYDLHSLLALGSIGGPPAKSDSFAGLASRGRLLYSIDRADHQIIAFTTAGAIVARTAVGAGMRDLAFDESDLLLSHWSTNERALRTYDIVELPQ